MPVDSITPISPVDIRVRLSLLSSVLLSVLIAIGRVVWLLLLLGIHTRSDLVRRELLEWLLVVLLVGVGLLIEGLLRVLLILVGWLVEGLVLVWLLLILLVHRSIHLSPLLLLHLIHLLLLVVELLVLIESRIGRILGLVVGSLIRPGSIVGSVDELGRDGSRTARGEIALLLLLGWRLN